MTPHDNCAEKIWAMLDKMEETRTINAPVMVAALRKAVRELDWYSSAHSPETLLTIGGDLAFQALCSIEQMLLGGGGAEPDGESVATERKPTATPEDQSSGPFALGAVPPIGGGPPDAAPRRTEESSL